MKIIKTLDIPLTEKSVKRFWSKVLKSESGCWVWKASIDRRGYGKMGICETTYKAHRISWVIHFGPIPNNLFVCHKCDNPSCVNPNHLFIGSQQDNVADMVSKGRDNPHNRKVTHCPRNHPYSKSNTRFTWGRRQCRECDKLRVRMRRLEKSSMVKSV